MLQDCKPVEENLLNKSVTPAEDSIIDNNNSIVNEEKSIIDLTEEFDHSIQNSTVLTEVTEPMETSLVDDIPSEKSFSKHLERRPSTAQSTPAKPEASIAKSDQDAPSLLTPRRKLDCPSSPLVDQG